MPAATRWLGARICNIGYTPSSPSRNRARRLTQPGTDHRGPDGSIRLAARQIKPFEKANRRPSEAGNDGHRDRRRTPGSRSPPSSAGGYHLVTPARAPGQAVESLMGRTSGGQSTFSPRGVVCLLSFQPIFSSFSRAFINKRPG